MLQAGSQSGLQPQVWGTHLAVLRSILAKMAGGGEEGPAPTPANYWVLPLHWWRLVGKGRDGRTLSRKRAAALLLYLSCRDQQGS